MRTTTFTIPGKPVPKARARQGRGGHWYTPGNTVEYENLVALMYRSQAIGAGIITGPVELRVMWRIEMAKSWTKKKRSQYNGQPHTQKPDADNLLKCIKDGLNGIAWADDAQVWKCSMEKRWTDIDSETGVMLLFD